MTVLSLGTLQSDSQRAQSASTRWPAGRAMGQWGRVRAVQANSLPACYGECVRKRLCRRLLRGNDDRSGKYDVISVGIWG